MCRKLLCLVLSFFLLVLAGCGSSNHNSQANDPPLQITTQSPLPPGRVNVPYSATFTASGGTPPYSWSASNLPTGLVMSTAGTLSGTPTAQWGPPPLPINVAVSDAARQTVTGNFGIQIAASLTVTTTSLLSSSPGMSYSTTLGASGGFPPYTWSITQGSLPSGLTLNASTGVISGTTMDVGTSNFTVQVSDTGPPPSTTTANLSITIFPPPVRGAALYIDDGTAYKVNSDGSLTQLPTLPLAPRLTSSPTLPLVFTFANGVLQSLLVDPDYSLIPYTSGGTPPNTGFLSVDPSGSTLYYAGQIDSQQTNGVLAYTADGSFQLMGSVTTSDPPGNKLVFTPNATLAFLPVAHLTNNTGSLISFTRAPNGSLTLVATSPISGVPTALAVSADGRYLAVGERAEDTPGIVQIFSINADGTLTPVTQLTVTYDSQGDAVDVNDLTWDSSGTYLLLATSFGYGAPPQFRGGVAVLSFSGTSLSETVYPVGDPVKNIQMTGSFVYAHWDILRVYYPFVDGFDFQNGELTELPASPWMSFNYYGVGDMTLY